MAVDPEGTGITYSIQHVSGPSTVPSGAINSSNGEFSWLPPEPDPGQTDVYVVDIVATDADDESSTQRVEISVTEATPNRPPDISYAQWTPPFSGSVYVSPGFFNIQEDNDYSRPSPPIFEYYVYVQDDTTPANELDVEIADGPSGATIEYVSGNIPDRC
jgi:hypothetical protein